MSPISKYYSEEDLNRILDKVSERGIENISKKESNILENISKNDKPLEENIEVYKKRSDEVKEVIKEMQKLNEKLRSQEIKEDEANDKLQKNDSLIQEGALRLSITRKYIMQQYGVDVMEIVPDDIFNQGPNNGMDDSGRQENPFF